MSKLQVPPVRREPAPITRAAPATGDLRQWRRMARRMLGLRVALNAMLVLAVLYTLALAHSLFIPLVLAAFIGLGLNPVVAAATRWHIPRALATLVLMAGLGFGLGSGVTMLAQPAANWLQRAPRALRHVAPKLIWGWMWGIPGALLAVPMLTSVKLVTAQVRGWRWFSLMVER